MVIRRLMGCHQRVGQTIQAGGQTNAQIDVTRAIRYPIHVMTGAVRTLLDVAIHEKVIR